MSINSDGTSCCLHVKFSRQTHVGQPHTLHSKILCQCSCTWWAESAGAPSKYHLHTLLNRYVQLNVELWYHGCWVYLLRDTINNQLTPGCRVPETSRGLVRVYPFFFECLQHVSAGCTTDVSEILFQSSRRNAHVGTSTAFTLLFTPTKS